MDELLHRIDAMIKREEAFLPKLNSGTSQRSLLANRIAALHTVRALVSSDRAPSQEELKFALPRIESIIHKMDKARDNHQPGSRNYKRFDPIVQAMLTAIVLELGINGCKEAVE